MLLRVPIETSRFTFFVRCELFFARRKLSRVSFICELDAGRVWNSCAVKFKEGTHGSTPDCPEPHDSDRQPCYCSRGRFGSGTSWDGGTADGLHARCFPALWRADAG